MKKLLQMFLFSLLAVFMLAACNDEEKKEPVSSEQNQVEDKTEVTAYPKTFTDGRGKEVIIKEKPTRIVSTTLAVDEYLLDLADIENIIAVTQISTDAGISNVAGLTDSIETKFESVTSEQVIVLNPDLVIVPSYVNPEVLDQLDDAGLTTYQVKDDTSFEGVLETVKTLGEMIGEEEKATAIIEEFNKRVAAIEEKAAAVSDKKRVLYYTQYDSTVTGNTTIGEMITLAGGTNIITEAGIVGDAYPDYPSISKEKIVELNPDVIITDGWDGSGKEPSFITAWKNDPAFANLDAVKNDQIFALDSANLTTASHYVIEGAEDIYNVLYGK